jgi:hypothetical protein
MKKSDIEDRLMEIMQSEQKKKNTGYNEAGLDDLYNNIKRSSICVIKAPEGRERMLNIYLVNNNNNNPRKRFIELSKCQVE